MTNRIFVVALVLAGCLTFATQAEAQRRIFRSSPDNDAPPLPRQPSNVNPDHEKKKTEADGAYRTGDFSKAIDLMNRVLQQNPIDSVAYYLRASSRVDLGVRNADTKLIRDGIADSREAIRHDTLKTAMYYLPYLHGMKSLASFENRRDHAETAVTVAGQILTIPTISAQDKANLLFQRSQAQGWLGKSDAAIADCEEALRLVPVHFGARAALADLFVAAGKTEQATAAFNKLVESFPDSPLTYNNRGMFFQRQGKYPDAIADFTRAVERDANYHYAITNRGFTLLQADDPAGAEADLSQSLKVNPQQPFVYNLRGLSKLARGDVAGAIEDQRTAVAMSTNDPTAHGDLGFLLVFAEDFPAAIQEFDAALAINPQFRHLYPWKIAALKRTGATQDLKQQFAGSAAKDSKQRDWVDHLIAYLVDAEKEADLLAAASTGKDALKTDQACEANFFIALVNAAAGKKTEAAEAYQRAVATKSRHLSAYRGAQFALAKSKPAEKK